MSYRSLSPFYDMLFGRIPERPLQPPEPSQEELKPPPRSNLAYRSSLWA